MEHDRALSEDQEEEKALEAFFDMAGGAEADPEGPPEETYRTAVDPEVRGLIRSDTLVRLYGTDAPSAHDRALSVIEERRKRYG